MDITMRGEFQALGNHIAEALTRTHSQIAGSTTYLGAYEIEADAARAWDKVATALGRREEDLNFKSSGSSLKIVGPRTEGADKLVVDAVETARKFVASGGNVNRTSQYSGVHKHNDKWWSQIRFGNKNWYLGLSEVEADAAWAVDQVASALGRPLNFQKVREVAGQRSAGADKRVADAVKAANAFVLGEFTAHSYSSPVRHHTPIC